MNFINLLFGQNKNSGKRGYLASLDKDQVKQRWEKIEELKLVDRASALREAVIEADKLVDFSLRIIYQGREGAADRLKEAKALFVNQKEAYENLWYAHKIRNEMVHTVGFELPIMEAKNILEIFQKALEIIGAL